MSFGCRPWRLWPLRGNSEVRGRERGGTRNLSPAQRRDDLPCTFVHAPRDRGRSIDFADCETALRCGRGPIAGKSLVGVFRVSLVQAAALGKFGCKRTEHLDLVEGILVEQLVNMVLDIRSIGGIAGTP